MVHTGMPEGAPAHPGNDNVKQAAAAERQTKARVASGSQLANSAAEADKQVKDQAKQQDKREEPNLRELQRRKQLLAELSQQRDWSADNKRFAQLAAKLLGGEK